MGKSERIEQNLIVHIGESEAEVTNVKRLRSRYRTVEVSYREATAELLVLMLHIEYALKAAA